MIDLVLHGYAWTGLYHQAASLFIEVSLLAPMPLLIHRVPQLHDVFGLTPSPRSYESLLLVASLAKRYEECAAHSLTRSLLFNDKPVLGWIASLSR